MEPLFPPQRACRRAAATPGRYPSIVLALSRLAHLSLRVRLSRSAVSDLSTSTDAIAHTLPVNAYTDESGNTGDDVFNVDQPDFYTLTLVAKDDLNVLAAPHVARWSHDLGVTELHGNELGVGRLETIAESMLSFIIEARPLFILTVVEKRHVVTMKLVDLVLDSGLNDAVSPIHYSNRFMRLGLADIIAERLSPKAQVDFWRVYAQKDGEGLRQILGRLRWNIVNRCDDQRARQLIVDAIDWASRHVEVFVAHPRGAGDTPNVVAFSLLLHGLMGSSTGQAFAFLASCTMSRTSSPGHSTGSMSAYARGAWSNENRPSSRSSSRGLPTTAR
jgi:hypothetical protein